MQSILFMVFVSIAIATVLNLVLKKFSISHIIGYIITGILISNHFHFNGNDNLYALELIAEFGIVFLMFTIGLEMSFQKMKDMKDFIFLNGSLQVVFTALLIYLLCHFVLSLDTTASLIIALAFSLSSSAIVLPYFKRSKDIHTPYGERSTAILIFQDVAVIPILLLIQFLSHHEVSIGEVLLKTSVSALLVIVFMFTIGKKIVNGLLKLSSYARLEELFLGAVLSIVIGASLFAHELGFTYSLGAFIAGMIIAETHYHVKVESDISSYKDILLGAFFFSIGTQIDIFYMIENLLVVIGVLSIVMMFKAVIIFLIIRKSSNKSDSVKSALALCQIGEFSFAIFTLAIQQNLLDHKLGELLILVTVLSMIIAPFVVNNIYKLASYFVVEFFESDKITPIKAKNHVVICGFSTVGRIVARQLSEQGIEFVIISDNLKHVLEGRKRGYMAYFGHLDKLPVIESLNVEESSSIVLTMDNITTKRIICEAILNHHENAHLIVKINTISEKDQLSDLKISSFIHAQYEAATLLAKQSLKRLNY